LLLHRLPNWHPLYVPRSISHHIFTNSPRAGLMHLLSPAHQTPTTSVTAINPVALTGAVSPSDLSTAMAVSLGAGSHVPAHLAAQRNETPSPCEISRQNASLASLHLILQNAQASAVDLPPMSRPSQLLNFKSPLNSTASSSSTTPCLIPLSASRLLLAARVVPL
jgi:hypothetical protein